MKNGLIHCALSENAKISFFRNIATTFGKPFSAFKRYEKEMEKQATSSYQSPIDPGLTSLAGSCTYYGNHICRGAWEISQGRFAHPRLLMSYSGLVPWEDSSGGSRWQGGITKAGNAHIRRVYHRSRLELSPLTAIRRHLQGTFRWTESRISRNFVERTKTTSS